MNVATRSSKKRCRDSKPDSPRKKPKHHTPLSQAFLVEDTPYCPPTTSRRVSLKKSLNDKTTSTIFPKLAKKNRRDPFHVLNDDEVYQIIAQLPVRETETLRRVSKLWKAASENHCGKHALLKHFPWAASKVEKSMSREDSNLQFRRYCTLIHHKLEYFYSHLDYYKHTY